MLTEEQKAKIEENRKRALALRAQKQESEAAAAAAAASTRKSGTQELQELLAQGGFTKEGADDNDEESSAPVPPTPPAQPASPPKLAGKDGESCEVCGSGLIDPTFQEVFAIQVCTPCKNLKEEEYGLLSKGDAVAEFLLQEGTIRVMPFLQRSNPRNTKYTAMKLYCRKQLRAKAYERWGGEEGLAEEMDRRRKRKYESALEKTVNIFARDKKRTWTPGGASSSSKRGGGGGGDAT